MKPSPDQANHCDVHISGLSIDELQLVGYARDAATALLNKFPNTVFTSGRRDTQRQAGAMAGNVVRHRKWISQTYLPSPERESLQLWIDQHPEAKTSDAIAAGLLVVMNPWTDLQRATLSRHFSGQAFDIAPVVNGDTVKAFIRTLPNLRKFLDSEGGLTIWHADFEKA